ncbi:MAG: hypothetical protein AUJ92_17360 [Armatimonadetes bacterium CG2_30_59_28]|nr:DUF86 domain-containing protein [Armatimonadota bacterium]OIO91032.1 MAG: hypothetical protein AUJ92_17360 [Armatimonadetes bacterium CG2_30_59_28]
MEDAPEINTRLVRSQVAHVRRSLRRLRQLSHLPVDDFVSNPDNFAISEHHFRRSLEALFDAGRHIIARSGFGVAYEYANVPRLLAEGGVLSDATSAEVRTLAKLREPPCALLWQVTPEEMHGILNERLTCIESCCVELLTWMKCGQNTDTLPEGTGR